MLRGEAVGANVDTIKCYPGSDHSPDCVLLVDRVALSLLRNKHRSSVAECIVKWLLVTGRTD